MNVLFTCGGTAGHVNPAVALARIFQERHPGCRILFVGADGGMENKLVPKEGYQIRSVTITNFHRSFAPADIAHNLGTLMNMQRSKKQARAILDALNANYIRTLESENQSLKLSASQANQNAVLMAAMDANKAEILRRTGAECPTPAYVVQPPQPVNFPTNCCGQFNGWGNGCGNCGC